MADKDDQIYKNLEYVSKAYFAAEGAFPFWESAFALIVGQIFIAYFDSRACNDQGIWMIRLGLGLSLIWFILVSLNMQYANHMDTKMQTLRDCLRRCDSPPSFIWPWPEEKDRHSLCNLIIGKKEGETIKQAFGKMPFSTWLYRRSLPFVLACFWAYLLNRYAIIVIIFILVMAVSVCYIDERSRKKAGGGSGNRQRD